MDITIIRTDTIIITTEIAIIEIFKEAQTLIDEEVMQCCHHPEDIIIQIQPLPIVAPPMCTEEADVELPHHDTIRIQEVLPAQEVLVQRQGAEMMITVEVREEALNQDHQEEVVIAEVILTTEVSQIEIILKAHEEVAVVILSQKLTIPIEAL